MSSHEVVSFPAPSWKYLHPPKAALDAKFAFNINVWAQDHITPSWSCLCEKGLQGIFKFMRVRWEMAIFEPELLSFPPSPKSKCVNKPAKGGGFDFPCILPAWTSCPSPHASQERKRSALFLLVWQLLASLHEKWRVMCWGNLIPSATRTCKETRTAAYIQRS